MNRHMGGRAPLMLTWNGLRLPLQEWIKRVTVPYATIIGRVNAGWPHGEALGLEPHERKKRDRDHWAGEGQFLGEPKRIYGMSPEAAAIFGLIDADEYLDRYK